MPVPPDPRSPLLALLARASSPQERLTQSWVRATEPELAAARFSRWVAVVAAGQPHRAAEILTIRGLDAQGWQSALGDAVPVPGAPLPRWAAAATDLYQLAGTVRPPADGPVPTLADVVGAGLPDWVDGGQPWRFHRLFAPWQAAATTLVGQWCSQVSAALGDQAQTDLVLWLIRRMLTVTGPTLMAAGSPGAGIRPSDWWLATWEQYPVLARLLGVTWLQWQDACEQLVTRIGTDLPGIAPAAPVIRIRTGAGDQHAGGRTVVALELADGRMLFGKPYEDHLTPLVMRVFTGLVQPPLGLRLPVAHHRPGWTWTEQVQAGECPDVDAWFWRAGALLGVLCALGATDVHHENLVSTPDGPVLIDLETALNPAAAPGEAPTSHPSPLPTSMLSAPVDGLPGQPSCDIGGLAGPAARTTPYLVATLTPGESGEAKLARAALPLQVGTALPIRAGAPIPVAGHHGQVLAGFAAATEQLADRASGNWDPAALLGPADPEAAVRYVPRPTQIYTRLLAASLSEPALADGVARELVLERLWLATGQAAPELIHAEQESLRDLDVPRFTVPITTRDCIDAPDGRAVPHSFAAAPLANAQRRMQSLADPAVAAEATADVAAGLFVIDPDAEGEPTAVGDRLRPAPPPEPIDLLIRQARPTGDGPTWWGVEYDPSRLRWRCGQLSPGLSGQAGIGLALVVCAADQPAAVALGEAALLACARRITQQLTWTCQDAITGVSGVLWALARAGAVCAPLTDAAFELLPLALRIAEQAAAGGIPCGFTLDPVAGAALATWALPPDLRRDEALSRILPLLDTPLPAHQDRPVDAAAAWITSYPSAAAGRELAGWVLAGALPTTEHDAASGRAHPGAWGDANIAARGGKPPTDWEQLQAAARTGRGLLELAQLAATAAVTAPDGPWPGRARELRAELQSRAGATGVWLPGLNLPDSRNLSAVHGMAALAILGSGAGSADRAPHVNVRILQ